MKETTKAFMKEARENGMSFGQTIHSYDYAEWTGQYIK